MQEIKNDVLAVLSTVEITGNNVKITEQLDRKLYLSVNEVLERVGGKWNKKAKAHVFNTDPTDRFEAVINSGTFDPKMKTGYFPTPEAVAKQMIALLDIQPNDTILEPSAGQGHIADLLPKENLIIGEILLENRQVLIEKGYRDYLQITDFLLDNSSGWDRIIMNPPFEKQQDIVHVVHAFNMLAPNGILVSVMSAGVLFRNNTKTKKFRDEILSKAQVINLPEGSFKSSGTNVNAIIIKIKKEGGWRDEGT